MVRSESSTAPQISNLRYSRVQLCATFVAARCASRIAELQAPRVGEDLPGLRRGCGTLRLLLN